MPVGRFAPSPTGRMHLGNVFTALLSWRSVKSRGGRWILRIEDLDPQRSRREYALQIEDDLAWLGLTPDEGGTRDKGPSAPYRQSMRSDIYAAMLERLHATGLTYPCTCTRADIMSTQAPHGSDGRIVYSGKCRPAVLPREGKYSDDKKGAVRLYVPDETIVFTDLICGPQRVNPARECGDFVLRRADGAWAYMLAVVADDALMGVTEVMRGNDLLLSAAQQIYLYRLLGYEPPRFAHVPLVVNARGVRLSKRDASLSMETLRSTHTPRQLIGKIAYMAVIRDTDEPVSADELLENFNIGRITRSATVTV